MDACISNNFIFIFFIIVKNYCKVKRPETEVAESIRSLSIRKLLCSNFLSEVELLQFMLRIASEQYEHEAYLQQKSFWNGIYSQSVNTV